MRARLPLPFCRVSLCFLRLLLDRRGAGEGKGRKGGGDSGWELAVELRRLLLSINYSPTRGQRGVWRQPSACVCVCVCVCPSERERERAKANTKPTHTHTCAVRERGGRRRGTHADEEAAEGPHAPWHAKKTKSTGVPERKGAARRHSLRFHETASSSSRWRAGQPVHRHGPRRRPSIYHTPAAAWAVGSGER